MDRDILPLLVVATAVLAALLAAAALLAPVDARAPDPGGAAGGIDHGTVNTPGVAAAAAGPLDDGATPPLRTSRRPTFARD